MSFGGRRGGGCAEIALFHQCHRISLRGGFVCHCRAADTAADDDQVVRFFDISFDEPLHCPFFLFQVSTRLRRRDQRRGRRFYRLRKNDSARQAWDSAGGLWYIRRGSGVSMGRRDSPRQVCFAPPEFSLPGRVQQYIQRRFQQVAQLPLRFHEEVAGVDIAVVFHQQVIPAFFQQGAFGRRESGILEQQCFKEPDRGGRVCHSRNQPAQRSNSLHRKRPYPSADTEKEATLAGSCRSVSTQGMNCMKFSP